MSIRRSGILRLPTTRREATWKCFRARLPCHLPAALPNAAAGKLSTAHRGQSILRSASCRNFGCRHRLDIHPSPPHGSTDGGNLRFPLCDQPMNPWIVRSSRKTSDGNRERHDERKQFVQAKDLLPYVRNPQSRPIEPMRIPSTVRTRVGPVSHPIPCCRCFGAPDGGCTEFSIIIRTYLPPYDGRPPAPLREARRLPGLYAIQRTLRQPWRGPYREKVAQ